MTGTVVCNGDRNKVHVECTIEPTPIISEEVNRLASAVQDAVSRGFSVLTCLPKDKAPYQKYSPHAVNSSTRNLDVALAAYSDNVPANFGVGCGPSNLTVVDC